MKFVIKTDGGHRFVVSRKEFESTEEFAIYLEYLRKDGVMWFTSDEDVYICIDKINSVWEYRKSDEEKDVETVRKGKKK